MPEKMEAVMHTTILMQLLPQMTEVTTTKLNTLLPVRQKHVHIVMVLA